MDINEAFIKFEKSIGADPSDVNALLLIIKRAGIKTSGEYINLCRDRRNELISLRGIGPKRLDLADKIFAFLEKTHNNL